MTIRSIKAYSELTNDPYKDGQLAYPKRMFGKNNRYAVAPVHSIQGNLCWTVWDAQTYDTNRPIDPVMGGEPAIIARHNSFEEVIEGLA